MFQRRSRFGRIASTHPDASARGRDEHIDAMRSCPALNASRARCSLIRRLKTWVRSINANVHAGFGRASPASQRPATTPPRIANGDATTSWPRACVASPLSYASSRKSLKTTRGKAMQHLVQNRNRQRFVPASLGLCTNRSRIKRNSAAALARRQIMLDVLRGDEQRPVVVTDRAQGEKCRIPQRHRVGLIDGAERHAGTGIHEKDDGQFTFFDVAFDERCPMRA